MYFSFFYKYQEHSTTQSLSKVQNPFIENFPSQIFSHAITERDITGMFRLFDGHDLLSTSFDFTDATGRQFINTTLVKYLWWSRDFAALKYLYEYFKEHSPEQLKTFQNQCSNLKNQTDKVTYRYKDTLCQESNFSLDDFIDILNLFIQSNAEERAIPFCLQIGLAQRQFPEHIIYRYLDHNYFQIKDVNWPFGFGFKGGSSDYSKAQDFCLKRWRESHTNQITGIGLDSAIFIGIDPYHISYPYIDRTEDTYYIKIILLPFMQYFKASIDHKMDAFWRKLNQPLKESSCVIV